MDTQRYDVAIIGAGVSGCSIARELSRLRARVLVIEREDDVCCGTSKANSAIVHAGFDAQTGTLMAKLNVEGSRLMPGLCEELGVSYKGIGSLVVCTDEEALPDLEALMARGVANGVPDLRIIGREELVAMEPNISDAAVAALWAPTGAIVNPFQLTIALAEDANVNGVDFAFDSCVTGLDRTDDGWRVHTTMGSYEASCVVNAAGVFADKVHAMASATPLKIVPRRGQYYVLDTTAGDYVTHTVFALPTKLGKGVLVTPTTAGNLLVGPTAEDIDDKDGIDTTAAGLAEVAEKAAITAANVPLREVVTSFSGLRAHRAEHEFLIGEAPDAPGFVDCAAIESPGLSASPAIGRRVATIVADLLGLEPKPEGEVEPWRANFHDLEHATADEWKALIAEDPAYGRIVCRCRKVSEGQIVDAIHAPLGARSLDAVKRRTEACMGRCQAGFCTPKIMEILAREVEELGLADITKDGPGSGFVVGRNKELEGGERA